jgi:ligand-binding sensor domain-containing protein
MVEKWNTGTFALSDLFGGLMSKFARSLAALLTPALLWGQPGSSQAPATGPTFKRISLEHGLPASRVNVITQTRDGVMWFGTREGFCKYQNGGVTVYAPNAGEGATTAGNDVRVIYEDRSGILWIGLFGGGMYRFDRVNGKLSQYKNDPGTPGTLSDNRVLSILEDRGGTLWIGTVNGLNTFDRTNLLFSRLPSEAGDSMSLTEPRIWPLCEDRTGNLWIGTLGGGLNRLQPSTGIITAFRHDPDGANSLASNSVIALYNDRSGRLWVGMENGGLDEFVHEKDEFDRLRQEFRHHLHGIKVTSITEDSSGNILVGTLGSGLKILDKESRTVTSVANDPADPRSLSDNTIRCVFVDRTRVLWVGTDTAGISVVSTEEPHKPSGRPK